MYIYIWIWAGMFHVKKNKNPAQGFPKGRIHQTKRASMFNLKQIETLEMDSPKGEYTRRKWLEFLPTKSKNPENGFPEGRIHQTERAGIFTDIY